MPRYLFSSPGYRKGKRRQNRRKAQKKSSRPARFRGTAGTTKRYRKTASLSAALRGLAETEIISKNVINTPIVAFATTPPAPPSLNSEFYYTLLNLGSSSINGLTAPAFKMFSLPMTDVKNNYYFMKKNICNFEIKMQNLYGSTSVVLDNAPINFRFLVLKPKLTKIAGNVSPQQHLWIDENGDTKGFDTVDQLSTLDMHTYMINKKKYHVIQDRKFTLQRSTVVMESQVPPVSPGALNNTGVSANSRHPSQKFLRHTTLVNKKCYYGDELSALVDPFDYHDDTFIVCYAYNIIDNSRAYGWSMSLKSTTAYTDM